MSHESNDTENIFTETTTPKTASVKRNFSVKLIALVLILSVTVGSLSGAAGAFFMFRALLPDNTTVNSDTDASDSTLPEKLDTDSVTIFSENDEENTVIPEAEPSTGSTQENTTANNESVTLSKGDIYAVAVNSIVSITSTYNKQYTSFFGSYSEPVSSRGTGFIITDDGYIITNYHVIENGEEITVTDYDGQNYTAVIVGSEPSNDVAVLKIDAKKTPVTLGDSSSLQVGDDIMVIGNALGELSYTFTDGIVSHLSRSVSVENGKSINMFQTNAAINSGNSGGPVYNMQGEVVGIASAKYASETIEGLGFCIPIDDVKEIISDIIIYGYVTGKPSLDISVQTVTSSMSSRYSLPVGCYIVSLDSDGAAYKAGLRQKDVITKINSTKISSCEDISKLLSTFKAGESITITYYSGNEYKTATLTLSEYVPSQPRTDYSNVYDY